MLTFYINYMATSKSEEDDRFSIYSKESDDSENSDDSGSNNEPLFVKKFDISYLNESERYNNNIRGDGIQSEEIFRTLKLIISTLGRIEEKIDESLAYIQENKPKFDKTEFPKIRETKKKKTIIKK